ncbi:MAG: lyase family protein [Candidatus Diapherotrites archaeon]|nr:lyase family protein [Candidatus Diapherotrites archaeon]
MDAVRLTLGQEFASYEALIGSAIERLECSLEGLKEIPLGGTAVGTGITTHPNYRKAVIAALSKESGFKFSAPKDNFELMHSMNAFVDYSNALRCLAISLHKTCNDLMFLSSGPKAGIAEIILPEVEPGSSIMPGKVNPSISEAVKMSCFYVEGLDAAVAGAAKEGHLEINVYTPVILFSLEQATGILSSSLKMFSSKCISGIKADKKRCSELLFSSYSYATALNPYLGYAAVAELIKEALHRKISIEQLILEKGFISKADLARMLSVSAMAKPCRSDLKLKKKISRDKKFIAFLKSIR